MRKNVVACSDLADSIASDVALALRLSHTVRLSLSPSAFGTFKPVRSSGSISLSVLQSDTLLRLEEVLKRLQDSVNQYASEKICNSPNELLFGGLPFEPSILLAPSADADAPECLVLAFGNSVPGEVPSLLDYSLKLHPISENHFES